LPAAASSKADPVKCQHLDRIRHTFVDGYHATLEDSRPQMLAPWLNAIDPQFRGFAPEGATPPLQTGVRLRFRMVNAAFLGVPPVGKEPAYEVLRRQVQVPLALREELVV
jgi:hypothetical protein